MSTDKRNDREAPDDEAVSSLYGRAPRESSPAELDRKILAAARDGVGARPHARYLRWFPVVSITAMAALVVLVVLPILPPSPQVAEPETHPLLIREEAAEMDTQPDHSPQEEAVSLQLKREPAARSTVARQRQRPPAVSEPPPAASAPMDPSQLISASPPAPAAPEGPDTGAGSAVPEAQAADSVPETNLEEVIVHGQRHQAQPSPFASTAPLGDSGINTSVVREPAQWLREIALLLDKGEEQAALQQYQRFLIAHPNYVVDGALSQRLDNLRASP